MSKSALVVGSGFGGIAAALRLRKKGYQVRLLEAREQFGGRASVFYRDGHVFDAGPTVITAPYLIDELFHLFSKKRNDYVEFIPVDPFYRVNFKSGEDFDYVGDEERLIEQIRRFEPKDVDGYRKMVKHIEDIFNVGYVDLADKPFERFKDMLKVMPDMIRLGSYRSVYGLVSKYLKDDRLRQVFSFQPLLVGGSPFRSTSIYTLIHWLERKWGVYFAKGGTNALVAALIQLARDVGIECEANAQVSRVMVNSSNRVEGVELLDGRKIVADIVTINADPTFVYKNLIDSKFRKTHRDANLDKRKQSMSLFVAYFGTDKVYDNLAHHTIVLGPRYEGLLDDIFKKKILADDFSLYLHAPTRSDESMAPPGKDTFYVLSPVPNLKTDRLGKHSTDWDATGKEYLNKILVSLESRGMKDLRKHITTKFFVTPNYFRDELHSVDGAAFGLEPTLLQSAYFRFHNRSEDVSGLYFVGAGTHPGGGIPGVLCSAKVLERLVPEVNERRIITRKIVNWNNAESLNINVQKI